jgi:hypothetical protein
MIFTRIAYALCSILVGATLATASTYNMEERFDSPDPLPREVLAQITSHIGAEFPKFHCLEKRLEDVLQGKAMRIGADGRIGFLVLPNTPCACAVWSCPFWVFVMNSGGKFELAGKIDAGTLTVDESRCVNGLFQLETYSGTAGWEDESKWTYNGQTYIESERVHSVNGERDYSATAEEIHGSTIGAENQLIKKAVTAYNNQYGTEMKLHIEVVKVVGKYAKAMVFSQDAKSETESVYLEKQDRGWVVLDQGTGCNPEELGLPKEVW